MSGRGFKLGNEYAGALSPRVYEQIPKAVLAAIAVSFAMRLEGENTDDFEAVLLAEWKVLHANGIVPQRPPL